MGPTPIAVDDIVKYDFPVTTFVAELKLSAQVDHIEQECFEAIAEFCYERETEFLLEVMDIIQAAETLKGIFILRYGILKYAQMAIMLIQKNMDRGYYSDPTEAEAILQTLKTYIQNLHLE
jgi:hypothetical protein